MLVAARRHDRERAAELERAVLAAHARAESSLYLELIEPVEPTVKPEPEQPSGTSGRGDTTYLSLCRRYVKRAR